MAWPLRIFLGLIGLWFLFGVGNGLLGAAPVTGSGVSGPAAARYAPGTGEAIPADLRAATFDFAPELAAQDRQVIEAAVAGARPEARRLIEMVDGLTAVSVGATPSGTAGTTTTKADGYHVMLDLGTISRELGPRGVSRLVLHELGHVVDHAVLSEELRASLDAGIPAGWGCEGGSTGACAARAERFAESFAKWAMNDIGVDIYIGYKVPPPGSLDAWGEPLARLAVD